MEPTIRCLPAMVAVLMLAGCSSGDGSPKDGPPKGNLPAADSWNLTLKISVPDEEADGGLATNRLVAGQEESASDEFDNAWDVRAFLAGPVKAYFAHSGESGYQLGPNLWQDIRTKDLPVEWRIDVIAEAGRDVTVRWEMPEGEVSCDTNAFVLEDSDGNLGTTDLCAVDNLTYEGDGLPLHLILRVS